MGEQEAVFLYFRWSCSLPNFKSQELLLLLRYF